MTKIEQPIYFWITPERLRGIMSKLRKMETLMIAAKLQDLNRRLKKNPKYLYKNYPTHKDLLKEVKELAEGKRVIVNDVYHYMVGSWSSCILSQSKNIAVMAVFEKLGLVDYDQLDALCSELIWWEKQPSKSFFCHPRCAVYLHVNKSYHWEAIRDTTNWASELTVLVLRKYGYLPQIAFEMYISFAIHTDIRLSTLDGLDIWNDICDYERTQMLLRRWMRRTMTFTLPPPDLN